MKKLILICLSFFVLVPVFVLAEDCLEYSELSPMLSCTVPSGGGYVFVAGGEYIPPDPEDPPLNGGVAYYYSVLRTNSLGKCGFSSHGYAFISAPPGADYFYGNDRTYQKQGEGISVCQTVIITPEDDEDCLERYGINVSSDDPDVTFQLAKVHECDDGLGTTCAVYEVVAFDGDNLKIPNNNDPFYINACPEGFTGTCTDYNYEPDYFDPCDPPDDLSEKYPPNVKHTTLVDDPGEVDWTDVEPDPTCSDCDNTKIELDNKRAQLDKDIADRDIIQQSGQTQILTDLSSQTYITNTKITNQTDILDQSIGDQTTVINEGLQGIIDVLDSDGDGNFDVGDGDGIIIAGDPTIDLGVESGDFDGTIAEPEKENLTDELDGWWNTIDSGSIFSVLNLVDTPVSNIQSTFLINYTLLGTEYSYTLDFSLFEDHLDFMGNALLALVSMIGVLFLFGGKEGF